MSTSKGKRELSPTMLRLLEAIQRGGDGCYWADNSTLRALEKRGLVRLGKCQMRPTAVIYGGGDVVNEYLTAHYAVSFVPAPDLDGAA